MCIFSTVIFTSFNPPLQLLTPPLSKQTSCREESPVKKPITLIITEMYRYVQNNVTQRFSSPPMSFFFFSFFYCVYWNFFLVFGLCLIHFWFAEQEDSRYSISFWSAAVNITRRNRPHNQNVMYRSYNRIQNFLAHYYIKKRCNNSWCIIQLQLQHGIRLC